MRRSSCALSPPPPPNRPRSPEVSQLSSGEQMPLPRVEPVTVQGLHPTQKWASREIAMPWEATSGSTRHARALTKDSRISEDIDRSSRYVLAHATMYQTDSP